MVNWQPNTECDYKFDYARIFADLAQQKQEMNEQDFFRHSNGVYRSLILHDLYFILQFVMEIPSTDKNGRWFCNSPFVVDRCQEVENGPDGGTLDLWFRGSFKSSIRKARTVQRILKHPNRCSMIVSATRPLAKKHFRPVMLLLETSAMLKSSFPDVLYQNPRNEAPKWSEDDGIVVKRTGVSRNEATYEAWGIKEGMPIGTHFDYIDVDDLEVQDDVMNPDVITKVRNTVDLTKYLLTVDGCEAYWGTPYSHNGVYIPYIQEKKKADGSPAFTFRRYPATEDGLPTGKSVFLSDERLADIRSELNEYAFNCQMLINPTPVGVRKLEGSKLQDIESKFIPRGIYKFMVIDPAGDDKGKDSDAWAGLVIGVEPHSDNMGMNNIYITDAIITPMREEEAPETFARMYIRNGMIMQLGVEKVGQSTAELHIASALAKQGRYISVDNGSLAILRPAGRNKNARIEKAIPYPLYNNKMFISKDVPVAYRDRIRLEMDKYPFWHDDALDCISYFYDMVTDYRFGWYDYEYEEPRNVVSMTGRSAVTGY